MSKAIVLAMAPGGGKTQLITEEIQKRISEGMNPDNIYAVTFTREAASLLVTRTNATIKASTIHSLAASIVKLAGGEVVSSGISVYDHIIIEATFILKKDIDLDIDFLCVDEAQDLNKLQFEFINELCNHAKSVMIVGDPDQCQPYGTEVRLNNGDICNIETLNVDNRICSYDRSDSTIYKNGRINAISERYYTGKLYSIINGSKITRCTYNHKWLLKWNLEQTRDTRVTYIMQKGNRFRVGHCKLFAQDSDALLFHPGVRTRLEDADRLWILKYHNSKVESYAYEQVISSKYGIPQIVFNANLQHTTVTSESIDYIYESIGDIYDKVELCLIDHDKYFDYPIYSRENNKGQGGGRIIQLAACNIIPELMYIPMYPDNDKNHAKLEWSSFSINTTDVHNMKVISLDVDKYHTYVADGFLTCNSIYGFQGGSPDFMSQLAFNLGTVVIDSNLSHRLPTAVTKYINRVFSREIESLKSETGSVNIVSEGEVRSRVHLHKIYDMFLKGYPGTSGILFRTNAEVSNYVMASGKAKEFNYSIDIRDHPFFALVSYIFNKDIHTDFKSLSVLADYMGFGIYAFTNFLHMVDDVCFNKKTFVPSDKLLDRIKKTGSVAGVAAQSVVFSCFESLFDSLKYFNLDFELTRESLLIYMKECRELGFDIEQFYDFGDEYIVDHILEFFDSGNSICRIDNKSLSSVMTVHASKGLEFDNILYLLNRFMDIKDKEEYRIAYVAMTRAKSNVLVYVPYNKNADPEEPNLYHNIIRNAGGI